MDNKDRIYDEAKTVDMTVLLVEVLRRIGFIILWAIIFAILIGGVSTFRGYRSLENARNKVAEGTNLEVSAEARRQYEEELKSYEQQYASYQAQLDKIKDAINSKAESEKDSFILSTRPEEYYKETIIYYIDAHYTVNSNANDQSQNTVNSIMQAYHVLILNDAFFTYLSSNVSEEIDLDDLKKLVQLDIDVDSALMQLTVCSKTRYQTNEILKVSRAYLEDSYDKISAAIGDYEIKVVEILGASGAGIHGATDSVNEAWDIYLAELSASEEAIRERIAELIRPKEPQPEETVDQNDVSMRALAKNSVKRAILGAFLGVFLSYMYIMIRFIVNDYALSEDEIRRRFGLTVLSSTKRFPKPGAWNRLLSKLSGDEKRSAGVEEAALLAVVNINSILHNNEEEGSDVLLIGHNNNALLELSCSMYGVMAVAGGNILVDRHAVEMLDDYDNVVIAEPKESTSYDEIGLEYERLKLLGKNVVGIVAM